MENQLASAFDVLYIIIGTCGVAIIVWGVIFTLYGILILEFSRIKQKSIFYDREALRHRFATYLLLALEFLIAADIIATVIHPTFEEIAILASTVAIRTVISYFLEKEISKFQSRAVE